MNLFERFRSFIVDKLNKLHEIRAAPEAVAGGVAIGMFMGLTPFVGFKTLMSILVAWIARCSKLAAVLAVTLQDVLVPVAPIILLVEYKIGAWALGIPHPPPESRLHKHSIIGALHDWTSVFNREFFAHYVWPVFIGSIIIGLPVAAASYFATHVILLKVRKRKEALEKQSASLPE